MPSSSGKTITIVFSIVFSFVLIVVMCTAKSPQPNPLSAGPKARSIERSTEVRTDEEYAKASKQSHCSERYPKDFAMQAACGRNADSGRRDFVDIWNEYIGSGSMNIALQECFARYTENNKTDFAMAGACARNQKDGFKTVN
jgi:hypothetical protein